MLKVGIIWKNLTNFKRILKDKKVWRAIRRAKVRVIRRLLWKNKRKRYYYPNSRNRVGVPKKNIFFFFKTNPKIVLLKRYNKINKNKLIYSKILRSRSRQAFRRKILQWKIKNKIKKPLVVKKIERDKNWKSWKKKHYWDFLKIKKFFKFRRLFYRQYHWRRQWRRKWWQAKKVVAVKTLFSYHFGFYWTQKGAKFIRLPARVFVIWLNYSIFMYKFLACYRIKYFKKLIIFGYKFKHNNVLFSIKNILKKLKKWHFRFNNNKKKTSGWKPKKQKRRKRKAKKRVRHFWIKFKKRVRIMFYRHFRLKKKRPKQRVLVFQRLFSKQNKPQRVFIGINFNKIIKTRTLKILKNKIFNISAINQHLRLKFPIFLNNKKQFQHFKNNRLSDKNSKSIVYNLLQFKRIHKQQYLLAQNSQLLYIKMNAYRDSSGRRFHWHFLGKKNIRKKFPWLQSFIVKRNLYPLQYFNMFRCFKAIWLRKRNKIYKAFISIMYHRHDRIKLRIGSHGGNRSFNCKLNLIKTILPFYGKLTIKQFNNIWRSNIYIKSHQNGGRMSNFAHKINMSLPVILQHLNWAPNILWAQNIIKNGWVYLNKNESRNQNKFFFSLFPLSNGLNKNLLSASIINTS